MYVTVGITVLLCTQHLIRDEREEDGKISLSLIGMVLPLVFLPGKSHGRGVWWDTVHEVAKESDMTYQLNNRHMRQETLGKYVDSWDI